MTEQQSLEWDANTVMEQIHMAESRHMQMGALCSYLLQYQAYADGCIMFLLTSIS